MKLRYTSGRLSMEVEASTQKEAFKELSSACEVFGVNCCGACNSENFYPRVRTNDGNDYHEFICRDCKAVLSLGVHKTGGSLFPKRKNDDGSYKENNGWVKWKPSNDDKKSVSKRM